MHSIVLATEINLCTGRTHERGAFGLLAIPLTRGVKDRLKKHLYTYAFKVMQGDQVLYSEGENAADKIFDTKYQWASTEPQRLITSLFWMGRMGCTDLFLPLTTYGAMKVKGTLIVPAVILAVIVDIATFVIRLLTSFHLLCQKEHPLKTLILQKQPGITVGDRVTVYMTGWNVVGDDIQEESIAFEVNFTSTPRDVEKYDRRVSDLEPRSSGKYATTQEKADKVVSMVQEIARVTRETKRQEKEMHQMALEDKLSRIESNLQQELARVQEETDKKLNPREEEQRKYEQELRRLEEKIIRIEEEIERSKREASSSSKTYSITREVALERLGLKEGATLEQIKQSFRKLAMQYHPDRRGGNTVKMQELQEAYERL